MSRLIAINPDGTEVELKGDALRRLVYVCRNWVLRHPWSPMTETDDGSMHPQLMAYTSKADIIGFGGSAGGGKGLALDTLVPTPAGLKQLRYVHVGDQVLTEEGLPTTVTAVVDTTGLPCFRITFDDKTTIIADDVHRWWTFTVSELRHRPLPVGSMKTTAQIIATLLTSAKQLNHAVQPSGQAKRWRYIKRIEPVTSVPTRCITVDNPTGLYLVTKAEIVTHNTDLACGLAVTDHRKSMILRRVGTELTGIIDRLEELIGSKAGFNGQQKIWRRRRHDGIAQQIEFASLPNLGDERGYQGRPHDLIVFDEASNFLEAQVRFLLGWLRTTIKGQRCRALLTFNPPTSAEGQWIVPFFGPWLDRTHPRPAKPGELRWFATDLKGRDVEVPDGRPFVWLEDGSRHYDFKPSHFQGHRRTKLVTPMSRTFIPSRVTDNPYLFDTGYMTMLQALPEPLRSQMLEGDFEAGMQDDVWQVIPTAWIDAAMARWTAWEAAHPGQKPGPMDSLGVDVARGGGDETVLAPRHGVWFDHPHAYPGSQTPSGRIVANHVLGVRRDWAVVHIDVIGVGSSPFDTLRDEMEVQVIGVDVRNKSLGTDASGMLSFLNLRSELVWRFRELLDPDNNKGVMLPPNQRLRADLAAFTWKSVGRMIQVESKEEIEKRIGRSPDYGSAYILAQLDTPKLRDVRGKRRSAGDYDPYSSI